MKKSELPSADSIQKLAEFWDTHNLTDFENELEEVSEQLFERDVEIEVRLAPRNASNPVTADFNC